MNVWVYVLAYMVGAGALAAALTHAWWGAGRSKAELRRAALHETNTRL